MMVLRSAHSAQRMVRDRVNGGSKTLKTDDVQMILQEKAGKERMAMAHKRIVAEALGDGEGCGSDRGCGGVW